MPSGLSKPKPLFSMIFPFGGSPLPWGRGLVSFCSHCVLQYFSNNMAATKSPHRIMPKNDNERLCESLFLKGWTSGESEMVKVSTWAITIRKHGPQVLTGDNKVTLQGQMGKMASQSKCAALKRGKRKRRSECMTEKVMSLSLCCICILACRSLSACQFSIQLCLVCPLGVFLCLLFVEPVVCYKKRRQ